MVIRSLSRYAVAYAVTELAAAALLIWAFGLGWTFVILAVTFMAGVVLAGAQLKGQVVGLRRMHGNPRAAAADGALVGLGTALVFLPGIVTTAAGALMLAPATRSAMRPMAAALLTRGIVKQMGAMYPVTPARRVDYIDGEVISETSGDAVALTR
jgi:UPF0716 protein FxsA